MARSDTDLSRKFATLVGLIAVLMWAVLALLSAASGTVPPFQLAAMTFLIGGLLGVASWPFRPGAVASLVQNWRVWVLGIAGLFGYHFVYFSAIRAAPPVEVSLLAYLWPLFLVVFSALLPGERLRWYHIAGVVLGLCGALLVISGGDVQSLAREWRFGHLLGFACAIIWAGYSVLSRRFAGVPTDIVAGLLSRNSSALGDLPSGVRNDSVAERHDAMARGHRPRAHAGWCRFL